MSSLLHWHFTDIAECQHLQVRQVTCSLACKNAQDQSISIRICTLNMLRLRAHCLTRCATEVANQSKSLSQKQGNCKHNLNMRCAATSMAMYGNVSNILKLPTFHHQSGTWSTQVLCSESQSIHGKVCRHDVWSSHSLT